MLAAARAVGAERTSSGSRTGRRSRRTRCSSGAARAPPSSANAGFEHLLHLRRQTRAHLYRLCEQHPEPLVPLERCHGVRGRLGPDGELEPLDLATLPDVGDVEAVAVCLLFAFRDPSHERAVAEELRRAASRRARRRVARGRAGVPRVRARVDDGGRRISRAGRGPVPARARGCARATAGLPEPLVMLSSGGVASIDEAAAHPATILVSGPAGGVVGAGLVARRAGVRERDRVRHGRHVDRRLPAAGRARGARGGARGRRLPDPAADGRPPHGRRGRRLARAPRRGRRDARRARSRRARIPGPRATARGGGADGDRREPPARAAAGGAAGRARARSRRGGARARRHRSRGGRSTSSNAEMLRALRVVSVERGHDPREFALVAFGGAGPLHACALAEELGIETVLVPAAAGVLSALGLVAGDERRDRVVSYVRPLAEVRRPAGGGRGRPALPRAVVRADGAARRRPRGARSTARTRSGTATPTAAREIELVAVRTADVVPGPDITLPATSATRCRARPRRAATARRAGFPTGWSGETNGDGTLVLTRDERRAPGDRQRAARGRGGDGRRARSAPRSRRTSRSAATARPRSSTSAGRMIAQAEHIPVHLGAMPDAVAAVMRLGLDAGRGLHPQRPVHGRHAPARRHARLAHRRSATPSRARTTPTSAAWSRRACPRSRATLDQEG